MGHVYRVPVALNCTTAPGSRFKALEFTFTADGRFRGLSGVVKITGGLLGRSN